MKSYVKVFAPILLAILIGLLTHIFARSERGDVGLLLQTAKTKASKANLEENREKKTFLEICKHKIKFSRTTTKAAADLECRRSLLINKWE